MWRLYERNKNGSGWFIIISLAKSDFGEEKEYVEIAKERGGQKRGRFNLNTIYVRVLVRL